jgi:hypothetical protein
LESQSVIYFLALQLSAAVLALVEILGSRLHQDSCWLNFCFGFEQIGLFSILSSVDEHGLDKKFTGKFTETLVLSLP